MVSSPISIGFVRSILVSSTGADDEVSAIQSTSKLSPFPVWPTLSLYSGFITQVFGVDSPFIVSVLCKFLNLPFYILWQFSK